MTHPCEVHYVFDIDFVIIASVVDILRDLALSVIKQRAPRN